ncbi:hypothetical protein H632_c288p0 [Helicosporidium sp. ATCC 50920]|nr:hypothetical protein H632_c288p0 [Helicosporidium sp. ATCC 50920]|eukprot:KDD76273.1 hypothetical protein H632_c288p0 [Helicosporidium sp. ATCC 50920]
MGDATLTYRHEAGMNFTRILPHIVVGSCPQNRADVARLAEEEGVQAILCLQEDCDAEHFGFSLRTIAEACEARGVRHLQVPTKDFDGMSLRAQVASAVRAAWPFAQRPEGAYGAWEMCNEGDGAEKNEEALPEGESDSMRLPHIAAQLPAGPMPTLYVHCTAGLGRAPAVAIALMWWVLGWPLLEAYARLVRLRPCAPRLESLRAAAVDLLGSGPGSGPALVPAAVQLLGGWPHGVCIAGLGRSWRDPVPLRWESCAGEDEEPGAGDDADAQICLDVPAPCEYDPVLRRGLRLANALQGRWTHRTRLLPGSYAYKLVVQGRWTTSPDHPRAVDAGGALNNVLQVPYPDQSEAAREQRARLLSGEGSGELTVEERERLRQLLGGKAKEDSAAS